MMPAPPGVITGKVYSKLGLVPGATVTLTLVGETLTVTTNAVGEYSISSGNLPNFSEGSIATLAASKINRGTVSQSVTLSDEPQLIELTLIETSEMEYNVSSSQDRYPLQFVMLTNFDGEKVTISNPLPVQVEDRPLARKTDGTTTQKIGEAPPGTPKSAAKWRIRKVVRQTAETTWANGNAEFDKVWNDRDSYTYS